MTTLDTLASSSARAVHVSVASVPNPVRGIVSTTRWFYFRRSLGYALAGSAAAILAVVALLVLSTPSDELTDVTATTVTSVTPTTTATPNTAPPTTIPFDSVQPIAPAVVPPIVGGDSSSDTTAPRIQILSPEAESRVKSASIVVMGLTESGTKVTYADDRAIDVGEDGLWSAEVRLVAGVNVLRFTATDEAGNQARASVTVIRVVDPPRTTTTITPTTQPSDTTTTTTKAPAEWEFTAHSTYGSCTEDPPYDVYYGTGKPGTQITIISEFGGGTTEVRENGEWSLKVFFPEALTELTFAVKVKDFTGAKIQFEFVSLVGI